jgi:UDP-N-acetylglucosamine 3-dehydrogenase
VEVDKIVTTKVGVIGLGYIGAAHTRIYKQMKDCDLVGVCDSDLGRRRLAEAYHTRFFADYQELLKEKLDAVSICTPTVSHVDIALEVLESDCHILVEKPFARTKEEAKKVLKKARDTGKLIAVGYVERFNPAIGKLKEIIDLSGIYSTLSLRFGPGSPRTKDIGVLLDLGSHEIDVLNYLMGMRPEVLYSQVLSSSNSACEDYAYVSLKYGHIHSHIETSWLPRYKLRLLSLYGNERFYILDYAQQSLQSHRPPPRVQIENGNWQDALWISRNVEEDIAVVPGEPLRLELQCFLESITRGEILEPLCEGSEAIEVLEVAEKALAASKRTPSVSSDQKMVRQKLLNVHK